MTQGEFEIPVELAPPNPIEWIGLGPVLWTELRGKSTAKCDDCLHVIHDHMTGAQVFDRPPGLARRATHQREQGGARTLHCPAHHVWRIAREE